MNEFADIGNNKHQQAGNGTGDEGARALSEALKTNTTLHSLILEGEQEESEEDGLSADIAENQHQQADNEIGDEGARALSDALKTNITLQTLNLSSEQEEKKMDELEALSTTNTNKQGTGLGQKEQEH